MLFEVLYLLQLIFIFRLFQIFAKIIDNFIKKLLKSYLQLIRLKKEKTIHSKTLFTISVDLKST